MICLRCSSFGPSVRSARSNTSQLLRRSTPSFLSQSKRTYLTSPLLHRPKISYPLPAISPSTTSPTTSPTAPTTIQKPDILPKTQISAHPALQGIQMRCGPRDTFKPSHFKRKRRHGFLARIRTRKGRAILERRRLKGRTKLSH